MYLKSEVVCVPCVSDRQLCISPEERRQADSRYGRRECLNGSGRSENSNKFEVDSNFVLLLSARADLVEGHPRVEQ
jgi:hypothetical protein